MNTLNLRKKLVLLTLRKPPLTQAEKTELETICRQFDVEDRGLVYDLYVVLDKPGSVMTLKKQKELMQKAAVKWPTVDQKELEQVLQGRRNFLSKLMGTQLFRTVLGVVPAMEATERLIAVFREMHAKQNQAVCGMCPLMEKCPAGMKVVGHGVLRQWDRTTGELSATHDAQGNEIDTDPTGLETHIDCPKPPDGAIVPPRPATPANGNSVVADPLIAQQAMAFLMVLDQILQNDLAMASMTSGENNNTPNAKRTAAALIALAAMVGGSGAGKADVPFDTTFTGSQFFGKAKELANKITAGQMQLFKTLETFAYELAGDAGAKTSPTQGSADTYDVKKMESYSEVVSQVPSQRALTPKALRTAKLAQKDVMVRQDMSVKKKSKVLGIIVDESGSMRGRVTSNVHNLISRGNLAATLTLAIIDHMMKTNGVTVFRFYAYNPSQAYICETKDDYIALARKIGLGDFNGGGTSIDNAISAITVDVAELGKKLKVKATDIILITDGDDQLTVSNVKKELQDTGTKLHTLHVNSTARGAVVKQFKDVGEVKQVDPNNLDLQDIVKVAASASQK
jgi:hypothetical protein